MDNREISKRLEEMERKRNMENITISMEEYKELLITKGKYEELKSQKSNETINWNPQTLTPQTLTPQIMYCKDMPKEYTTIPCNSERSREW